MVVLGVLYANLLLLCNMPFSYIMYHDELCVCVSVCTIIILGLLLIGKQR